MSAECLEGAAAVAPGLPIEAIRPTDLALFGDVAILLAVIAALYFAFKAISRHPWIPTSLSLAALMYAGVDRTWWNTSRVTVDADTVSYRPWVGADQRLLFADITGFTCEGGSLFPVVSDDSRIVLHGRDDISKIEIPRFLDRFPDIARVVADKVRPLPAP